MKLAKAIFIAIFVLLIASCANDLTNNDSQKYNENKNYLSNIENINNYIETFNSNETAVLVISQTNCSFCKTYKPKVNEITFIYDIDIYWLEFDKLTGSERAKLINLDAKFSNFGTPYTVISNSGKVIDEISGDTSMENIVAKFEKNNIIK